jgi:hypothetical protein
MKVILIFSMNSYILLRSNKETGPFSLAALQEMGLRPTDLIWIECQSMNWRHPYEINELKALLADDSKPVPDNSTHQVSVADARTSEITDEAVVEKKLVYVELPTATNLAKEKKVSVLPDSDLAAIQQYGGIADFEVPKNEITSSETSIKYSRPLDEIKEMYVKNLEQQLQSKKSIAFQIPQKYRQPLIYVCLILTGAGVALFFKNTGTTKETVSPQSTQQPISSPSTVPIEEEEQTQVTPIIPEKTELPPITPADEPIISTSEKPKEASIKKSIRPQQDDKIPATRPPDKSEEINTPNFENTRSRPSVTDNINSKLSIQANEYLVGSFGGIRNLEMTLQNNSNYLLDKVAVTIEYLNPEGIIIKTENIYFQSVHAGEKETLAVKKTNRGVKITYKITKIESKEISSTTAAF